MLRPRSTAQPFVYAICQTITSDARVIIRVSEVPEGGMGPSLRALAGSLPRLQPLPAPEAGDGGTVHRILRERSLSPLTSSEPPQKDRA